MEQPKWSSEAVSELRKLAEDEATWTAGQMAETLTRLYSHYFTRSSVISKLKREGIVSRSAALTRHIQRMAQTKWKTKAKASRRDPKVRPPKPLPEPPPLICDLAPLIHFHNRTSVLCAYISGEPSWDAPCCGRPVVEGTSWCATHWWHTHTAIGREAASLRGWETRWAKREMREGVE